MGGSKIDSLNNSRNILIKNIKKNGINNLQNSSIDINPNIKIQLNKFLKEMKLIANNQKVKPKENIGNLNTANGRKIHIYNFFNSKFGHDISIAICANIGYETAGSYNSKQKQIKGPARGLCQREGSRLTQLKKYNNWESMNTQLNFIVHELQTTESRAFSKIKSAIGISEKTEAFTRYYERPGKPNYVARANLARTINNDISYA